MTMNLVSDKGRQPPKLVNLTTADPTVILAGDAKAIVTVDSISWSVKGTDTTLSISITDGTTTAYLMDTKAVTQRTNGELLDRHIQLPNASWSISAEAGAGNLVDIVVVYTRDTKTTT